jgi:hypothetical protein
VNSGTLPAVYILHIHLFLPLGTQALFFLLLDIQSQDEKTPAGLSRCKPQKHFEQPGLE